MLLSAETVSVRIDDEALLAPITLGVEAGECLAVLGSNGAGKTTLLRVLAGRISPTSGACTLRGGVLDERRREARREIAALIDQPTLYPDLTLRENLTLIEAAWSGEKHSGRGSHIAEGLGARALETFGIERLAARFPHELSSGQRQLISLAVVFSRPASVLLLDEPEQRLDAGRRELLAEAIIGARDRGIAVVFASHDAALIDRVAERRVSLEEPAV